MKNLERLHGIMNKGHFGSHDLTSVPLLSIVRCLRAAEGHVEGGCGDGHWISQLHPKHFLSFCRQQSGKGLRVDSSHLRLQTHRADVDFRVLFVKAKLEAFCDLS